MSKCMECQFLLPVPRDAGDDQRHQDLIGCICGFWGEGFTSCPGPLTASGIRANQARRNVSCTRTPSTSTTPPP